MSSWQTFLSSPAYVINLASRPQRLEPTIQRLQEAGFCNVRRWPAVDGTTADLAALFASHGFKALADVDDFLIRPGSQGCFLSHFRLMKHAIEAGHELVHIFEDDIVFPSFWRSYAERFHAATPRDWNVLFMGSQLDFDYLPRLSLARVLGKCQRKIPRFPAIHGPVAWMHDVVRLPLFCTHAYTLTRKACMELTEWIGSQAHPYAIDFMYYDGMRGHPRISCFPLAWYAWNSRRLFPHTKERGRTIHWIRRNSGLVFQDEDYGSDIIQR
ncbi:MULTISPECIES: glycosyltransferase family 25 protein [unclassified Cyanobium]|uniref:glycosyltransferase family 25 protein n=1 Tax=unclassified Cyanobium TaxID=2627006 RepID=UPI0020CE1833|nr:MULTISPECIES: glycosyltransferase family 25 protein [unclassified Cyanobium]MCP9834960.1 glycosyltransferase family 25 protein [Cyanobium sp. La Preciosa 7G6]MCP9937723.1 glycosyltransferase family 25 protein [Cyanobium sp. Aljojuca 7A6]